MDKLIEKFVDILNELQKNIFVCFIILLPLCYTFLYIYSNSFARDEFLNKVIFSMTFDISLLYISISCASMMSIYLGINNASSIYCILGMYCNIFTISILTKCINDNTTYMYPLIYSALCFLICLIILISRSKKTKHDNGE